MSRSSTHSPIHSASETSPREALPPLALANGQTAPDGPRDDGEGGVTMTDTTIGINGMAHVILTVSQFAAARAFYGRLLPALGMTPVCDIYCVGARASAATSARTGSIAPQS